MKNWTVGIVSIMALMGCASISSSGLGGDKSLVLIPRIADGSYNTQTEVHKNIKEDIDHLNLYLLDGVATKATKVVPYADLTKAITFGNLKNGITYTVQAEAISTASVKISVDGSSRLTIVMGTDNAPTIGVIPVRLVDSPFSGLASTSIDITNGSYTYAASESIATASP